MIPPTDAFVRWHPSNEAEVAALVRHARARGPASESVAPPTACPPSSPARTTW